MKVSTNPAQVINEDMSAGDHDKQRTRHREGNQGKMQKVENSNKLLIRWGQGLHNALQL